MLTVTDRITRGGCRTFGCWRASSPSSVSWCHTLTILTWDFRSQSHAQVNDCHPLVLQALTITPWSVIPLRWAGTPQVKRVWRFCPQCAVGDIWEALQEFDLQDIWEISPDKFLILFFYCRLTAATTTYTRLCSTSECHWVIMPLEKLLFLSWYVFVGNVISLGLQTAVPNTWVFWQV